MWWPHRYWSKTLGIWVQLEFLIKNRLSAVNKWPNHRNNVHEHKNV
jgi:hypothetical protein